MAGGNRRATSTERNPERWAALVETGVHGMIEDVPLTRAEEADEALLMGLRLTEGIDLGRLAARTDLAPADHTINELIGLRLVQRSGPTRLSATRTGRMVLNAIVLQLAQSFVPAKTTQDTTG
jgi:oxygen-independent coproporphyrinogen-3 oxidase